MKQVALLFHHAADDWISAGIAWASHAEVSHVALLHPDGHKVVESSAIGYPKGVRVVPILDWVSRHPGYWVRYVDDPDPYEIWDGCAKHEGAAYDWMYFVGWVLRMKLEDPKKFVCQELIQHSFRTAGRPLFLTSRPHYITPQHLYMAAKPFSRGVLL